MEDGSQVHDEHYIVASASRADDATRVLKHGETFAVFDRHGDIRAAGMGEQGIFHEGTRHLSLLRLHVEGKRPLLLHSASHGGNELLVVDLTNPDVIKPELEDPFLRRGDLHLLRTVFLWQGTCYLRLRIANYSLCPVRAQVTLGYEADFADIFEVRGHARPRRGKMLPSHVADERTAVLAYEGLDRRTRRTFLRFDPPPTDLRSDVARYLVELAPHETQTLYVVIDCPPTASNRAARERYEDAQQRCIEEVRAPVPDRADVHCTNEPFNAWLDRSRADLRMLVTQTPYGPYPFAGVPWFSAPFGRDGIITALELLWIDASLARGVLSMLSATQAREASPERDAEPGKILHEQRKGEMAALGEIPFGQYYGSVDSTPLFVMLAASYYERTGDMEILRELWPAVERALRWIDTDGDPDGDGFVEYVGSRGGGLVNQGWKDSADSVSHADGTLADGPIALCEVQGYVYAARFGAALMADALGIPELAAEQRARAVQLRRDFLDRFWLPELETYALALDGRKEPCRVRSSNAGHCLWTGIALDEHARRIAHTLFEEDLFTGWGVRTLSSSAARYNPMSYHNGSVWPHDNAILAAGLARYGFQGLACRLLETHFEASTYFDLHRMPELFCGFVRRPGEGPTLYPVACAPQAWAAGAVYMLLSASLGLSVDAPRRQVRFVASALPPSVTRLTIQSLFVAGSSLDLLLDRHPHDVGLTVMRRDRPCEVVALK